MSVTVLYLVSYGSTSVLPQFPHVSGLNFLVNVGLSLCETPGVPGRWPLRFCPAPCPSVPSSALVFTPLFGLTLCLLAAEIPAIFGEQFGVPGGVVVALVDAELCIKLLYFEFELGVFGPELRNHEGVLRH